MNRTTNAHDALLDAAVERFTAQGFDATSVGDLASEAGITEDSFHDHFDDKQALWDAALERLSAGFDVAAQGLEIDVVDPVGAATAYQDLDAEHLADVTETLFNFYLHDPSAVALCRLVSLEQFRDPKAAEMHRRRFVLEPLQYQATLFIQMFGVSTEEAEHLALSFWGPIHLLLKIAQQDELLARTVLRTHTKAFVSYVSGSE
ncbi:TetR/AcrR family transcriptional regulator [Granulicoccus sp. GXG6511]|uniref:TetR/AcrR family transcriptional regulator n=1 Tax=Granulicoccus sp. GXG6511 TaxID=3381351 RepID=UPI003D7E01DB